MWYCKERPIEPDEPESKVKCCKCECDLWEDSTIFDIEGDIMCYDCAWEWFKDTYETDYDRIVDEP